jgi:hypothetical protein
LSSCQAGNYNNGGCSNTLGDIAAYYYNTDLRTSTLGNATGIHKIGGDVGKAAQGVSHTGKRLSRKAKHGVKHEASSAHNALTKAGKDAKATVKNP